VVVREAEIRPAGLGVESRLRRRAARHRLAGLGAEARRFRRNRLARLRVKRRAGAAGSGCGRASASASAARGDSCSWRPFAGEDLGVIPRPTASARARGGGTFASWWRRWRWRCGRRPEGATGGRWSVYNQCTVSGSRGREASQQAQALVGLLYASWHGARAGTLHEAHAPGRGSSVHKTIGRRGHTRRQRGTVPALTIQRAVRHRAMHRASKPPSARLPGRSAAPPTPTYLLEGSPRPCAPWRRR
jgi:hypothetical protein